MQVPSPITHTNPALLVKILIFHNAFDYRVRIIARQVYHHVFRAKPFDTWNIRAIENMGLVYELETMETHLYSLSYPTLSTKCITVFRRRCRSGTGRYPDKLVHHLSIRGAQRVIRPNGICKLE